MNRYNMKKLISEALGFKLNIEQLLHSTSITSEEGNMLLSIIDELKVEIGIHIKEVE